MNWSFIYDKPDENRPIYPENERKQKKSFVKQFHMKTFERSQKAKGNYAENNKRKMTLNGSPFSKTTIQLFDPKYLAENESKTTLQAPENNFNSTQEHFGNLKEKDKQRTDEVSLKNDNMDKPNESKHEVKRKQNEDATRM